MFEIAHDPVETDPPQRIATDAWLLAAVVVTATSVAVFADLIIWAALPAVLAVTMGILWRFHGGTHTRRFGLPNSVTLFRLNLAVLMLVSVWAGESDFAMSWPLFLIAATALALDGVDGWLARRRQEASAFGERFDMAADTTFTIIVTLSLIGLGLVGIWVFLLGLLRPAFVSATRIWPQLGAPLPESRCRKIACAGSLACLVAGLAPPLAGLAPVLALAALLQLLWSFGRDLRYLLRNNTAVPVADII